MSSASRRVRTAICISAMPIRHCSTTTWRAKPAAGCCCASRISTRRAAGRNTRRRSTRTCDWLGISWQEPVRRQSEHFADYQAALAKLEAQGLLYPSFESRSEINALVAERDQRRPLAARSRWRAALSRQCPQAQAAERERRRRRRRALCAAARHRRGGRPRRRAAPGPRPAAGRTARPGPSRRCRKMWGDVVARAQGDADELSPRGRARRRACRA